LQGEVQIVEGPDVDAVPVRNERRPRWMRMRRASPGRSAMTRIGCRPAHPRPAWANASPAPSGYCRIAIVSSLRTHRGVLM